MTDSSPFQLTEAFQAEYRVNSAWSGRTAASSSPSNERGVAAKRLIRPAQLHDLEQLQRMIESIRFGIAIENGTSAPQLLQAMTQGKARWPIAI